MYSVGELARKANITVRTLHHYDQIGLLKPSGSTEGGHRLYSDEDVMRLEQISILKKMGLGLKAVREMLDSYGTDWLSCLEDQLRMVQREKEKLEELEGMLRVTIHSVQIEGTLNWNTMFQMIRLSQKDPAAKQRFIREHFTAEERKLLHKLPNLNKDDPLTVRWTEEVAQARAVMHEDPASPAAQEVAARITTLALEAFAGNEALMNKYWELHGAEGNPMNLYPFEPELLEFLSAAFEYYDRNQTVHQAPAAPSLPAAEIGRN
ncbi:MerR family transcriptional regulator [Paenibacillus chitinolyticus]|uniref:MerR family transcriptional regulator n=1 Tax=Paenibacillus chitinolyticus TaxID=79263 RepID=UPI003864417D